MPTYKFVYFYFIQHKRVLGIDSNSLAGSVVRLRSIQKIFTWSKR